MCSHPVLLFSHEFKREINSYQLFSSTSSVPSLSVSFVKDDELHSYFISSDEFNVNLICLRNGLSISLERSASEDKDGILKLIKSYHISVGGNNIPLFSVYPCGKCDECCRNYTLSLAYRCDLETSNHDFPPVMFTLTYDNEHLPSDGVIKSDVSSFIKRFRWHLTDKFGCSIKFLCVSEYGGKYGRPHYHCIIWGLPLELYKGVKSSNSNYFVPKQICSIAESCWRNGFIFYKTIYSNGSISYVMKYLSKCRNKISEGFNNPTFILRSLRPGIGFIPSVGNFFKKLVSEFSSFNFENYGLLKYKYLNYSITDGIVFKYNSSYVNKYLPTFPQLIGQKCFNTLKDIYCFLFDGIKHLHSFRKYLGKDIVIQFNRLYDTFVNSNYFEYVRERVNFDCVANFVIPSSRECVPYKLFKSSYLRFNENLHKYLSFVSNNDIFQELFHDSLTFKKCREFLINLYFSNGSDSLFSTYCVSSDLHFVETDLQ